MTALQKIGTLSLIAAYVSACKCCLQVLILSFETHSKNWKVLRSIILFNPFFFRFITSWLDHLIIIIIMIMIIIIIIFSRGPLHQKVLFGGALHCFGISQLLTMVNKNMSIYKITKIVHAFLFVKNLWFIVPVNPQETQLFYKSNRPHFLWVYQRDNPIGMLGEHSKSL